MSDALRKIAEAEGADFIGDPKDPIAKFLIWPTVQRMQAVGVARLTIAIRDGKVAFEIIPEDYKAEVTK